MQAIKLSTRVGRDHRIEIDLPPEVPEGEVEVIVLIPETASSTAKESLRAFFEQLDQSLHKRLTKEEIDRYIAEERASWD